MGVKTAWWRVSPEDSRRADSVNCGSGIEALIRSNDPKIQKSGCQGAAPFM
jgi:hypothetical protein